MDTNKYLDMLYDPTKWDQLSHDEVNRQFHHNLTIASTYVDTMQRQVDNNRSREMFSFL